MRRDHAIAAIARTCKNGLAADALWTAVLPQLRRAVSSDALWAATVDPTTLLFTQDRRIEIPRETGPYLVDNEILRDDVNKFTDIAHDPVGVRTLMRATAGVPEQSARYRDVFAPLGLGDELRAALRSRGATWGFLCLHRDGVFTREDAELVRRVAPHIADGLRLGMLVQRVDTPSGGESALFVLGREDTVIATSVGADHWRDELGDRELPIEVRAVAAALRNHNKTPSLRVRTRAGRWAILEASWMTGTAPEAIAVIVRAASADEMAPVVMRAYGLTEQERAVSGLVLRGCSTRTISDELRIGEHTVQDHLKAIFDKTGVRSRRELVASVLRRHYLKR